MKSQDKEFLVCFLSIFLLLDLCSIADSDLESDRKALLALRMAIGSPFLPWNISDGTPCNWTGVTCRQNRVVALRLPRLGLFGQVPIALGNLTRLQTLSLRFNAFSGPLPADFVYLASLRNLYLQGNFFSGHIPDFFVQFEELVTLNLANNNFTDVISSDFNKLTRLKSEEKLTQKLKLLRIHSYVKTKAAEDLKQREKVEISIEEGVTDNDHANNASEKEAALGLVKSKSSSEFDLEDLLKASAELLGKGTFGTTYKAIFETGRIAVVKRLKYFIVSEKEFEEMVEAIEKMNNQNLVPIRAYHYSEDEMLLVYEYMHMGSLSDVLHGNKGGGRSSLNWETRTAIALEAARAIVHIHSIDPSTCHGNIKSSNVFLTTTYKVRVSKFGLANVAGPTRINGYLAPEVMDTGKVSQKADVYSFGVLLLEFLTGKDPTESYLKDEGLDLPQWMISAVNDEWTSAVFDVELLQYKDVEEIMLQLLELAFSCTAQLPDYRPSMEEVTIQIKNLCSSSLQVDRDPVMNENVLGQIYKGPKAWKIYTTRNRELQQRSNPRENENIEPKGLVFFGNEPDVFELDDLLRASAEVLGQGTFGTTYKATLEMGKTVCVKRLKKLNVSRREFQEMVEAVGKINHENLNCLRGYYHSKDENLLIHDYMPMGSLYTCLHENRSAGRTPLNWETRCGIALGAARAIEYIHSQYPADCHGNIKSSNVLLTETFEVHVSDFGLASVAGLYQKDGYRAPEVTDASKVSQKADAYSFGVLLMELVTGEAPVSSRSKDKGIDLPRWIQSMIKEESISEVFDLELLQYQNVEEDMVKFLQIAISCTAEDPKKRPSMTMLKFQIKKLIRPSSQVVEDDKSFQQMEDGKSRFGYMISLPDEG